MKKSIAILAAAAEPFLRLRTRRLDTTEYIFHSKKVKGDLDGYRILVVADLHGESYGANNETLLSIMKAQKPDLILLPGDLTDSYLDRTEIALDFARGAARLAPCYFSTGNHEHRMTVQELTAFFAALTEAGVHPLRGGAVQITVGDAAFRLSGVDCNKGNTSEFLALFAHRPSEELNIVLSHKPHFADTYRRSGADLVICGHAHGGQFRLPLVGGLYAPGQGILPKYTAGMYQLGSTVMAVSRGAGNSSFPIRLGNKPQLVTIILRR